MLLTAVVNTTCLCALVAQIGTPLGALSAISSHLRQSSLLTHCICACRFVLEHVINEYASFLKKLMPWQPKTILEGGGNIGVATILLAFMYPDAKVPPPAPHQRIQVPGS